MPEFKYEALRSTGEKLKGNYEAESKNHVLIMLKEKNLYPLKVEEVVKGTEIGVKIFGRVKTKDIAVFCRQFHVMLNAGVSLIKCLDILRFQTDNKKLKKVLEEVYEEVQKGLTFSEALKNQRSTFPDLLIHMVEAGEVSGTLDVIMERMAVHFEKENKIQNKVKGAMIYPIILSTVSVLVVVFLLTFVMPTFVGMFTTSGVELPLPTKILLIISNMMKKVWYLLILVLFMGIYGIKKYMATDRGSFFIDHIKMKIPVVKGTTQRVVTSRFTRTMSTLLVSGIPLIQAIEIVSKIVQNKIVEKGLLDVKEEVKKGIELATPIDRIGFFPPMVVSMIKIGEESGSLDEILDKTANFYDEEVEVAMHKMVTMLEPLMIVFMAVIIGAIVIAMVLPMFDMINTVNL
ncbi:type II secretion system F family protein [Wukongibacter baidiensis]|uniref:type II secretion system F family protein n=1 Tax=Wukongibacter baidiensis TaxID=1723361 RepID=UPI003D7F50D1